MKKKVERELAFCDPCFAEDKESHASYSCIECGRDFCHNHYGEVFTYGPGQYAYFNIVSYCKLCEEKLRLDACSPLFQRLWKHKDITDWRARMLGEIRGDIESLENEIITLLEKEKAK